MTDIIPPQEIEPYLNPAYWNGHTLGHGELTEGPDIEPPASKNAKWGDMSRAQNELRERLARIERIVPIETYGEGDEVDLGAHEPGTVVLFRDERLWGRPLDQDELESVSKSQIPTKPNNLPSGVHATTLHSIGSRAEGATYLTSARVGIIKPVKGGKSALFSGVLGAYPLNSMMATPFGTPIVNEKLIIGAVGHTRNAKTRFESTSDMLRRVNLLEIIAPGSVEKRMAPSRLASLLISLSPR